MSYPQYPGGYQPYPATPGAAAAPSSGTAITSGVLACIGAVGQLLGGGFSIALGLSDFGRDLSEYDSTGLLGQRWYTTYAVVTGSIGVVTAILLGVGAVALFTRRAFGRVLIVTGCAVVVLTGIVGSAVTWNLTDFSGSGAAVISGGIGGLLGLIFPVATAVLALVPATARWLAHDRTSGYAQPMPMYPHGPAAFPHGSVGQPPVAQPPGSVPQPQGPVDQQHGSMAQPQGFAQPAGPAPYPYPPVGYPGSSAAQPNPYPQTAPTYPELDSVYPQPDSSDQRLDPTMKADGSPWQRPPAE